MKVALLTQGYEAAGGVQAVTTWLRDGLLDHGHTPTVINAASSRRDPRSRRLLAPRTWRRGPWAEADRDLDAVHVGSAWAEYEPARYRPRPVLSELLAENDVVVVVAGGPALALAAGSAGVPVVLQVATRVAWERESILAAMAPLRRFVMQAMTRRVSRMEPRALQGCRTVLVENPEMADEVARLAPDVEVVLAPPGVPAAAFARPHPWTPQGPIVSVGRLTEPRKGWARMFEAYAHLRSQMPDAPPLVIGGRGGLLPADRAALDRLGLADHVQVHCDLAFEDVVDLLGQASVFWQTSYEEGLGLAVLEAMAAGLPVVATRTAGTEMTVEHGVSGALVDHGPLLVQEFADHTREYLQNGAGVSAAAVARVRERFDSAVTLGAFVRAVEQSVRTGG